MSSDSVDKNISFDVTISDKDVYEAMKDIPGYLDITVGDFKELYQVAFRKALARITSLVQARDIMNREVVSVEKEASVQSVADLMAQHEVSGVPVINKDKKVVGIISEKDFLCRMGTENTKTFMGVVAACLKGKGCVAVSLREQKAGDIMKAPPITANEETTVREIASLFTENTINRVPVLNSDGYLTGIVTRTDIVRVSFVTNIS